ncbi:hypothetical protein D5073_19570 [Pectobacterium versatile]|nr:hypothetical protein D5073_19570 [Pectobacterium versatile]RJL54117.1 hypothetical protein D5076_18725 [Pectobacterium versatile]RJL59621.1 hypothetical protein D5080_17650 [Pectobacterium versatile]TAI92592.1 hypothetical protein EG331_00015 [Pectobacterium versatile]
MNFFQQKGREFMDTYQKLNSKKSNSTCMYGDCAKKAINSHCFSESSALGKIAENGKLITATFKRDDKADFREATFDEVGIHNASTFKGFCHEHDSLFYPIDTAGIKTHRDIFLQLYRSACHSCFTDNIFNNSELKTFGKNILHNPRYEDMKNISHLKMVELFFDLLHDFEELNTPIIIPPNSSYTIEPFSKKVDIDIRILIRKLNFAVPVTFQNNLTLNLDGIVFDLIFIVIPFEDTSLIIAASDKSQIKLIHNMLNKDISALNLVESMFMNDANFFLSKKIFNLWQEDRKKAIANDYKFINERHLFEEYDISLFDEIRMSLIKKSTSPINNEYKKMTQLPLRKDFHIREEEMNLSFLKDKSFRLKF